MSQAAALQKDYRLAEHVRACHVDGQVILLDLHRDKYFGVGGMFLSALSNRIADWPVNEDVDRIAANTAEIDRWIISLSSQGLLAQASTPQPIRTGIAEPLQSLFDWVPPTRDGVQWRRTARIACSTIVVGHWLRRYRLAVIVKRIADRRPPLPTVKTGSRQDQLQSAVAWYLRMRPLISTSHDQCLRDSLTLVHFLASEDLLPHWVIGVRTRPFAAHSWVQHGNLVLNDLHETVRRYTPILIV